VTLLVTFFREIGLDCFFYIPKRLEDGYGLSREGLECAAAQGANVIVTVDCGISANQESLLCLSLGIDLIITDHHTPGPIIPRAFAVVNPHLAESPSPFHFLAGVGVAFFLLIALRSRLREEGFFSGTGEPNLRGYLDLVALGTVADIVPLIDENRIFVKYGLAELTQASRLGVQALKSVAGVSGQVGSGAVGFRLAPRLNAAGRLEDAALGVELLLCGSPEKAMAIASQLDASNNERQALEQEILSDALAMVRESERFACMKSIVLASKDWHQGVIGIVASRIVDLFHRPTILISLQDRTGKGSGRSIPGFHLYDALLACSEHLVKFGGHKYAAGLSINETTLENFVEKFDAVAQGLLSDADLTPVLAVDSELAAADINLDLADFIKQLAPFGIGNPEPIFVMRNVSVVEQRVIKGNHLKFRLSAEGQILEAIGFNLARGKAVPEVIDVAFSLEADSWSGRRRIQLRIKDYRDAAI
jgi:single-stranded-DNA-specific exonuclease